MKVRIKKVPQARTGYQVQGSLANDVPAMGGADYNTYIGKPSLKASKYMTAVPREEANLEAEGGETVYGDINGDGMPEHKTIKGPRHSGGGVPLNLPDDTFIYSDFRGMNIKEPEFLQMFGKGGKGNKSYTPAALAKQYDIEKYRKILQDPDSDKIDRKTAELMIKNYQNKLAALALVQEGKKGFPQGMPAVAKPMTAENQYTEDTFVDPSIKQFAGQIDGKLQAIEQQQNTEQQDPDFAQQAQQAQEMNQGQPVAQPGEMGQPMARYGLFKAKKGMAKDPCPPGMVYDPVYGCISVDEKDSKEYTPEQINEYLDKIKTGSRWFKDLQENLPTEMFQKPGNEYLRKMYKDNHIPYEEVAPGQYIVPEEQMNIHQKIQKNHTDEQFMNERFKMLNKMGIPPNKWVESLDKFDDQYEGPGIKKSNDSDYRRELEQQDINYEKRMENCPCRKKQVDPVSQSVQEICVPCEQMAMAQYGMSMGGYDLPYGDDMPEAEYGMSMGITSKNYMGRPKSAMYARGGALRTYQGAEGASSTGAAGGAPAATPAATTDDGTLDVTGLDPDASNKKYQIWMKHNPGKEPKIMLNGKPAKYVPPTKPTGDLPLSDLKAINEIGYKMLEKEITNPNSKVRATLIEEAQAAYKDPKTGGKIGISKYRKNRAVPTGDEIINGILTGKKRNDAIKESGMDMRYLNNGATAFDTYDELKKRGIVTSQDEYDKKKKEYESKGWDNKDKIAKTLKITLPTPDQTLIEQTGAHGIARMQNNKVKGAYNKWGDDDAYQLETLFGRGDHDIQTNTGGNDETEMAALYGDNYNTLSPIEGFAGQSTLAHGANPNTAQGKFEAVPEEKQVTAEPCPCTRADGSTYELPRNADGTCPPCETEGEATTPQKTEPKMWLQDKIKTAGAFGDLMSAKKYTPWAAKYDLRTPKPTFMDPTRELAANAEQANIQTQALGQFAGPQALSARSSGVMGAASKNAADVLAKYNNANVNIANQFESNIANIENQEQQLNTASQQKLYDQNTISNQQYDNTKRALRNNLMNQTTSGITNMMKTDALNQLYPQYQVDAPSGGHVTFDETKAKQIKHEMSGDNEQAYYEECSKRYKDEPTIQKCVSEKLKNAPSGGGNSGRNAFDAHNAKEGGFVYGDVTYPFIL